MIAVVARVAMGEGIAATVDEEMAVAWVAGLEMVKVVVAKEAKAAKAAKMGLAAAADTADAMGKAGARGGALWAAVGCASKCWPSGLMRSQGSALVCCSATC